MFILPVDHSDPSSPLRALPIEQLFDPRHNPPPPPSGFALTPSGLFNLIKQFYTRHNILENFKYFFSELHSSVTREHIETLIRDIPDDKLWALAFINCYLGVSGSSPRSRTERPYFLPITGFRLMPDGDSINFALYDDGDYIYSGYALTDPLFSAWFRDAVVLPIANNVTNRFLNSSHFQSTRTLHQLPYYFPLVCAYARYLTGQPYALSTRNTDPVMDVSAADALQWFSENHTAEIKVHHYPFHIALVLKVTNTFRRPLYRVFNYSQNPLDLVPWPIILPQETKPLLYGVELELSTDYTTQELVDAAKDPSSS
jgi:hypothetical protein